MEDASASGHVAELLKDWGYEKLIPTFENEEVSIEALKEFDYHMLEGLVPKAGPRALLWKKLQKWQFLMKTPVYLKKKQFSYTCPMVMAYISCMFNNPCMFYVVGTASNFQSDQDMIEIVDFDAGKFNIKSGQEISIAVSPHPTIHSAVEDLKFEPQGLQINSEKQDDN